MEPINLTDLRADAGAIIDDGSWLHGKTYIDPDDLLALIDIAEAAHQAITEHTDEDGERWVSITPAKAKALRQALARTTT